MTSRDFCYWLQGYFELTAAPALTKDQTAMVQRHLNLVFKHEIDPSIGGNAADLQAAHDGTQQYGDVAEPGMAKPPTAPVKPPYGKPSWRPPHDGPELIRC